MDGSVISISLLFAILLVIIIYLTDKDNTRGSYFKEVGPCGIDDEGDGSTGLREVIERCVPTESGNGCVDDSGIITYKNKRYFESCKTTTISSLWTNEAEDIPCIADQDKIGFCVPQGTLGIKSWNLECTKINDHGVNRCDDLGNSIITSENFIDGSEVDIFKKYEIGDKLNFTIKCDDFKEPICGDWIYANGDNMTRVIPDDLDHLLSARRDCLVLERKIFRQGGIFDQLKLGIVIFRTGCIDNDNSRTGNITESAVEFPILRTDTVPDSCKFYSQNCIEDHEISDLKNNELKISNNQLLCPGSEIGNNIYDNYPKKFTLCRFFMSSMDDYQNTDGDIKIKKLFGKRFYIFGSNGIETRVLGSAISSVVGPESSSRKSNLNVSSDFTWYKLESPKGNLAKSINKLSSQLLIVLEEFVDKTRTRCSLVTTGHGTNGIVIKTNGNSIKWTGLANTMREIFQDNFDQKQSLIIMLKELSTKESPLRYADSFFEVNLTFPNREIVDMNYNNFSPNKLYISVNKN